MAATSAINVARRIEGGWTLGVIGKRTYSVSEGRCEVAPEQASIVVAPRQASDRAGLEHDTDVALHRRQTDVVVLGSARPFEVTPEFRVAIRVGGFERRIDVIGDRRCERDAFGALRFTPPEVVGEVPLTWEMAYGGLDDVARQRYGDPVEHLAAKAGVARPPRLGIYGYSRNPYGRGYLIEASPQGLAACRLPALEDPTARLTPGTLVCEYARRWPAMPPVACTAWLPYEFFPRATYLGLPPLPYDLATVSSADFHEVRAGWLRPEAVLHATGMTQRRDARASQSAAMGMRADEVSPGAPVTLTHLHPRHREWTFRLPQEAPRMHVRLPGGDPIELPARVRTLLIEPDEGRVCLVWVGELLLEFPLPDGHLEKAEHAVVWGPLRG